MAPPGTLQAIPRPRHERQALEEGLAELPAQIAAYERELDATPPENQVRREMREWQIRRARKRLAELEPRLAALTAEAVRLRRPEGLEFVAGAGGGEVGSALSVS
jgi:predicted RNase H-like nuclease (RuvC/YqgF family)